MIVLDFRAMQIRICKPTSYKRINILKKKFSFGTLVEKFI